MSKIGATAVGVWEFIAGDDWVTAAGVVLALGITALIGDGDTAWFVMPLAVAVLLTLSVWRQARTGGRLARRRRRTP